LKVAVDWTETVVDILQPRDLVPALDLKAEVTHLLVEALQLENIMGLSIGHVIQAVEVGGLLVVHGSM
jgi:hypothetical protein